MTVSDNKRNLAYSGQECNCLVLHELRNGDAEVFAIPGEGALRVARFEEDSADAGDAFHKIDWTLEEEFASPENNWPCGGEAEFGEGQVDWGWIAAASH